MGLPHSRFGNVWESPLSGAILLVKLSLGTSFDGTITYSSNIIKSTKQTGGDVELYATGNRNTFSLAFTSKGEVYGTDNGCNSNFGDSAFDCTHDDPPNDAIVTLSVGTGVVGGQTLQRPDKVYKIQKGGYYGHPNLNRQQCAWIDPKTGKDIKGNAAPMNYVAPFSQLLKSSVNGIIEYTAAHFGSQLKGDLIAGTYAPSDAGATSYRIKTSGTIETLDSTWSDVSVAQGFFGEIIFPRVGVPNDVRILEPSYVFPSSLSARVVTPYRGGKAGGLKITVTGHKFGTAPTVKIDGKNCPIIPGSVKETSRGSILKCTTPAANPGKELVAVSVTAGGVTSTITNGFFYSLSNI
jgi:hypothetical protein